MRTKASAVVAAIVLAATAATLVAANLNRAGATVALPVQGDPVPGVDVSIEQSPGGIVIGQYPTDSSGTWKMVLPSGPYLLTGNPFTRAAARFRSNKDQHATFLIKVGPKTLIKTWDFSRRCLFTEKIEVPQGPPQTIEVTVLEGKACEATPTPN